MKYFKIIILSSILACVVLLSQCQKDPAPVTWLPPTQVGTPYNFVVPDGFPTPYLPADNPMTVEGVKLGRFLFYDTKLSKDLTMSCASCHEQFTAFSDPNADALSTGVNGQKTKLNSMPIFNLAWQRFFFWDGRVNSLEEQSLHPIEDPIELDIDLATVISRLEADNMYPDLFKDAFGTNEISKERIGKAIAQFERTIVSATSKFDKVVRLKDGTSFTASEQRGFDMFNTERGDCFHCHGIAETQYLLGAFGEDLQFLNNGLDGLGDIKAGRMDVTGDPGDFGRFKLPSVRNIQFSFPYMHDGSIPTLDSLIQFYRKGVHATPHTDPNMEFQGTQRPWTAQDVADLTAFLKTLTDFEFLENEDYQNPFE